MIYSDRLRQDTRPVIGKFRPEADLATIAA